MALRPCTRVQYRQSPPTRCKRAVTYGTYSRIMVKPRLKIFHTFGCPTFTLDSRLQNNQSVPKWHSRCRTGLYLGLSPRHARSVSLVLHLETARIFPQFHIQHDDFLRRYLITTTINLGKLWQFS